MKNLFHQPQSNTDGDESESIMIDSEINSGVMRQSIFTGVDYASVFFFGYKYFLISFFCLLLLSLNIFSIK